MKSFSVFISSGTVEVFMRTYISFKQFFFAANNIKLKQVRDTFSFFSLILLVFRFTFSCGSIYSVALSRSGFGKNEWDTQNGRA